jgi:DNA-binding response OmpR family regulator
VKRILIIDDEASAREILRRMLEFEGYEIVEAANGQEGVEAFRDQPCDLVITDMVMPIKDGLKTILEIRELAADVPVIAISGGGTISKERYLAVAGYIKGVITLAKPFTRQQIVESVHGLLRKDMQPDAPPDAIEI